jgi:hypothetical protein
VQRSSPDSHSGGGQAAARTSQLCAAAPQVSRTRSSQSAALAQVRSSSCPEGPSLQRCSVAPLQVISPGTQRASSHAPLIASQWAADWHVSSAS